MILAFLIGLFTGATLGVLLLSIFVAGKIRACAEDSYLRGRLDELTDKFMERAG